jgi:hypothetical protein
MWVVNITPRPLCSCERPLCQLNRRLDGPQRLSVRFGDEKNLFPMTGFETRVVQPVAYWRCGHVSESNNIKQNKVEQRIFSPRTINLNPREPDLWRFRQMAARTKFTELWPLTFINIRAKNYCWETLNEDCSERSKKQITHLPELLSVFHGKWYLCVT